MPEGSLDPGPCHLGGLFCTLHSQLWCLLCPLSPRPSAAIALLLRHVLDGLAFLPRVSPHLLTLTTFVVSQK